MSCAPRVSTLDRKRRHQLALDVEWASIIDATIWPYHLRYFGESLRRWRRCRGFGEGESCDAGRILS